MIESRLTAALELLESDEMRVLLEGAQVLWANSRSVLDSQVMRNPNRYPQEEFELILECAHKALKSVCLEDADLIYATIFSGAEPTEYDRQSMSLFAMCIIDAAHTEISEITKKIAVSTCFGGTLRAISSGESLGLGNQARALLNRGTSPGTVLGCLDLIRRESMSACDMLASEPDLRLVAKFMLKSMVIRRAFSWASSNQGKSTTTTDAALFFVKNSRDRWLSLVVSEAINTSSALSGSVSPVVPEAFNIAVQLGLGAAWEAMDGATETPEYFMLLAATLLSQHKIHNISERSRQRVTKLATSLMSAIISPLEGDATLEQVLAADTHLHKCLLGVGLPDDWLAKSLAAQPDSKWLNSVAIEVATLV